MAHKIISRKGHHPQGDDGAVDAGVPKVHGRGVPESVRSEILPGQ
jgi:hypothetical protein